MPGRVAALGQAGATRCGPHWRPRNLPPRPALGLYSGDGFVRAPNQQGDTNMSGTTPSSEINDLRNQLDVLRATDPTPKVEAAKQTVSDTVDSVAAQASDLASQAAAQASVLASDAKARLSDAAEAVAPAGARRCRQRPANRRAGERRRRQPGRVHPRRAGPVHRAGSPGRIHGRPDRALAGGRASWPAPSLPWTRAPRHPARSCSTPGASR